MSSAVFPQFAASLPQCRASQLTFRGNTLQGRFGWLRLTPAYSCAVVRLVLDECGATEHDLLLDPFCGTGTTLLAASLKSIPAHTVEINPFLHWFVECKCQTYSAEELAQLQRASIAVAHRVTTSIRVGADAALPWTPPISNIEKWWDAPILRIIALLFYEIQKEKNSVIHNLLTVAFCRVMIRRSHASFGHQSMSFKKTSLKKCETTLIAPYRNDLNDIAAEIADEFLTATQILVHGTLEQNPRADASVFLGDARHLQQVLPRSDYSVVITSPPYPNRMSYIRELRPYMYWTGFLRTGREAGEMDWEAIGGTWGCATSLLSQWSPMVEAFSPCHEFYKTIASVEARQPILSRYLHKYFCDVRQHISELKTVLRRGAKCFYVVGNSKFYNTMIPTEEYYADIFRSEGFVDVAVSPLRKRTSKKELFEYVVSARWE